MSSEEEVENGCGGEPAASCYDAAIGLQLVSESAVTTRVDRLLNAGTFGQVYIGTRCGEKVAIKLERHDSPFRQLLHEGNMYRILAGGPGIPLVHWFGIHAHSYNGLVLQLLGPSVYDLFVRCHHQLSVKTVLLLADQLLNIIEFVHNHKVVHRDLSPNNLMMGLGVHAHRLYLADFGLAKQCRAGPCFVPAGRRHFRVTRPLVGTIRYASVHAHKGEEVVGWRDDLESIAYIFIYLLAGQLPWQGLRAGTAAEKARQIALMKVNTPLEVICAGVPDEFLSFLGYARCLKLYELPDYTAVRAMLRALAASRGYQYDWQYDWTDTADAMETTETTDMTDTTDTMDRPVALTKTRTESADSGISVGADAADCAGCVQ